MELVTNDFVTPPPKLTELLRQLVQIGGSDLHLTPQDRPRFRVNGELTAVEDYEPLTAEITQEYAYASLTDPKKALLKQNLQVDASITLKGFSRFRINVCDTRCGLAITYRAIPFEPRSFEDLGIPDNIARLASTPNGLILITGPTGSGKSTTLAAFIDKINRERDQKIVTIEDPIEFLHPSKRCLVQQRELDTNTRSFSEATTNALRQDPDIVIGELRDLATIQEALRVAETGHLTFATLHSNSAASTITRMIDVFPATQQPQIRTQLSDVLIAVMSQHLLKRRDGSGRVMAFETMIPNSGIKNLIRENKIHQIKSSMATGQEKHQMVTINQSLARLVATGIVSREDAEKRSPDVDDFKSLVGVYQQTEHTRVPRPSLLTERRVS